MAVILCWVAVVGLVEHLSGMEHSVPVWYIFPVAIATWYHSRPAGILTVVASVLVWGIADPRGAAAQPGDQYWNAAVGLAFLLGIFGLLSILRRELDGERMLARTDAVTGAANVRGFIQAVDAELARLRRYAHPFSLAYLDLDDFKALNDRFGHEAGDALLRSLAQGLREGTRSTDLVARLGGDEFAVLLPETARPAAETLFEGLREELAAAARRSYRPVTISIGLVTFEGAPASPDEAIRIADDLMYEAKHAGKNALLARSWSRDAPGLGGKRGSAQPVTGHPPPRLAARHLADPQRSPGGVRSFPDG